MKFSDEEQLHALSKIVEALEDTTLGVLALGSAAVVLRSGARGSVTKDLDVHVYPVEDILAFQEALEEAIVDRLGGRMAWEPDGASITAHIPTPTQEIPVEIILGREDFIDPKVLDDAVASAEEHDGVLVPSWEHIVTMKAEAWFDRSGERKRAYRLDLREIANRLEETEANLQEDAIDRLVRLRPERKRREMKKIIYRIFENHVI